MKLNIAVIIILSLLVFACQNSSKPIQTVNANLPDSANQTVTVANSNNTNSKVLEAEKQKLIDEQQNVAKELEAQQKKIIAARANSQALERELEKTKKDIDATKKKIDGHKTW